MNSHELPNASSSVSILDFFRLIEALIAVIQHLESNVVNLSRIQASELKNCPCCCGSIYAPAAAHDGRNAFPA